MKTRQQYRINPSFDKFVNREVLPLTRLNQETFWDRFTTLINDFMPINTSLCETRERLQAQIDQWHEAHQGKRFQPQAYRNFLKEIGYIVEEDKDFTIETSKVDAEIAAIAGPQLVVPLKNARFALNAANARWGSLYDALYGTDAIPQHAGLGQAEQYNIARGNRVIQYAKEFLDDVFPLQQGSHRDASAYLIYYENLLVTFADGSASGLRDPQQFVASNGSKHDPTSIVLKNNGLHIEIAINRNGLIGSRDLAGIEDIHIESALTTIMDCEDSVAAVDSADKIEIYRNWLGLMRGDLHCSFIKNGKNLTRCLHHDKQFTTKDGNSYRLSGRSLLLIRNVGLHMQSHMIEDQHGGPIPEGIIDAVITSLIASIDLNTKRRERNSQSGSIYIVKPKLHGPEEVAFTNSLFKRVEEMLELEPNTIKLGIMDEERRTTINLKECIRAAKNRVAFINTGFLDRTGDEIHTSMQAGAFLPKSEIKTEPWLAAYEKHNVAIGLACGFRGKAQIGKGMWAMPDEMQRMLIEKIQHPLAGANTAWVPSPTAATLHALHYHKVDVNGVQQRLIENLDADSEELRRDILTIPLLKNDENLSTKVIENELENNIQGILGYVVHWIQSGIGCSKIPDINNVGLMEDRATLRISSQHIANWLEHGICSHSQVKQALQRMAKLVDAQNKDKPHYRAMSADFDNSNAFNAAATLIFEGKEQANGYTEMVLHRFRLQEKATQALQRDLNGHPSSTAALSKSNPAQIKNREATRFLNLQAH